MLKIILIVAFATLLMNLYFIYTAKPDPADKHNFK
jgi:hypothetical protein